MNGFGHTPSMAAPPLACSPVFRQAQTPSRRRGVELMEAHIADLCREHEIALAGSSARGRAIRWRGGRREISVPPIRGQVSYFIALHEIGHLIGRGRSAPRLESEANAWLGRSTTAWSSRRPPPAGRSLAGCAVTWSGPATASTAGAPRIPPREHPFWRLLALG